ncbi:MAG: hypothetical protein JNK04_20540, partial [Myxococcales bacterium]|nr:hypothetical protein [Myxococcales bacterium]
NARYIGLVVFAALPFAACSATVTPGFTKDEARQLGGVDEHGNDICAAEGWYGDGECDDFCVEADPDCPASNCPDPNDPSVHYASTDPEECEVIDFACAEGTVMFGSADCGCGCIDEEPPGPICGGLTGLGCGPDEFCEYPVSAQCGVSDQSGTCSPLPTACPEIYAPVCACDGNTYSSACDANSAGLSVLHVGECGGGGPCTSNTDCDTDELCNLDYNCSAAIPDGAEDAIGGGYCEAKPDGCPDIYMPVCSCDGTTYGNACDAHAAGASVAYDGECGSPGIVCGGKSLVECPAEMYCAFTLDDMCGWADASAICQPVPQGCPDNIDPVCGCDGVTYFNECEANANGVAIVGFGECAVDASP